MKKEWPYKRHFPIDSYLWSHQFASTKEKLSAMYGHSKSSRWLASRDGWSIGLEGERESKKSVLLARLEEDDDDDGNIQYKVYSYNHS